MNKIKINSNIELVFVGDIHEHEEQFNLLIENVKPNQSKLLISLGDILDKGFGKEAAWSITNKLKEIVERGHGYVIKGNHELKNIKQAKETNTMNEHLIWLSRCPLSLTFEYPNGTSITAVHGGVIPKHKEDSLTTDVSVAYVREVDKKGKSIPLKKEIIDGKLHMYPAKDGGILWHHVYDGRFGYIVSGHNSQKDGEPKFFNYSCNIDSACYSSGILTALVMNQNGKKEVLSFKGTPKYPNYDSMMELMSQSNL